MKDKDLRVLHKRSGSVELFSFWHAAELKQFRRLFGLKYRPNTPEERAAFCSWIESQLAANRST